jgi:hypothetical protein
VDRLVIESGQLSRNRTVLGYPARASNIGAILKDQGDLARALEYTKLALRICQATYGPENPLTKKGRDKLAAIERAIKAKRAKA